MNSKEAEMKAGFPIMCGGNENNASAELLSAREDVRLPISSRLDQASLHIKDRLLLHDHRP